MQIFVNTFVNSTAQFLRTHPGMPSRPPAFRTLNVRRVHVMSTVCMMRQLASMDGAVVVTAVVRLALFGFLMCCTPCHA